MGSPPRVTFYVISGGATAPPPKNFSPSCATVQFPTLQITESGKEKENLGISEVKIFSSSDLKYIDEPLPENLMITALTQYQLQ